MKASWLIPSLISCSLLSFNTRLPTAIAQDVPSSTTILAQASRGQLTTWSFSAANRQLEFKTSQGVQPRARLINNPTRIVIDLPGIRLGRRPVTQPLSGSFQALKLGQFDPWTARLVIQLDKGYTLDPNAVEFKGLNPGHWTVQLPIPQKTRLLSRSRNTTPSSGRQGQGETWSDNNSEDNSSFDRLSRIRGGNPWGTSDNSSDTPQIEAIDLNSSQLLIRGSRTLPFTSGWERDTGAYRISLSAEPINGLRLPPTGSNSPFTQIQLRREGSNSILLLYPAASTRIGILKQINSRQLALELLSASAPAPVPAPVLPPISSQPNANNLNEIPIAVPPPMTGTMPSTLPPLSNPQPTEPLPTIPQGRLVVVIDPGHGGPDPGAIGIGGLREKDIVIDVSRQVKAKLEQQGVGVVLTRPDDRDLDLEPRVQIAKRVNATVFVSIHANAISMSRPDINGVETFYYSSWLSGRLASVIHRNVLQATGSADRGIRSARFYVLRRTTMPAVLVEVGFVTGRDDSPRLATENYRTLLADSIARGILEYLQKVR